MGLYTFQILFFAKDAAEITECLVKSISYKSTYNTAEDVRLIQADRSQEVGVRENAFIVVAVELKEEWESRIDFEFVQVCERFAQGDIGLLQADIRHHPTKVSRVIAQVFD